MADTQRYNIKIIPPYYIYVFLVNLLYIKYILTTPAITPR